MFWKTRSGPRCQVLSYSPHDDRSIRVRYAYDLKSSDVDDIDFVDVESRDLYLAGLDAGSMLIIDRKTARGAIA